MNSIEEPLTLQGLNSMVRAAINESMPARYWVTGELSEVRETAAGHCYIELVQRDEHSGELVAKARGTIWARIYTLLRPCFLEETGQPFVAGIKVLLQVTVGFQCCSFSFGIHWLIPRWSAMKAPPTTVLPL